MSVKSKVGNEIVIVKLFKNSVKEEKRNAEPVTNVIRFDAFGDYDYIDFELTARMETLAETIENMAVSMEQSILIPATDGFVTDDFRKSKFGAISFFLLDEKRDTDLFSYAQRAEEKMNAYDSGANGIHRSSFHGSIGTKAYVTMGSSAIALIGLSQNVAESVLAYKVYIDKLQAMAFQNRWQVYSYTIMFLKPDEFNAAESDNLQKLDSVLITFSWNDKSKENVSILFDAIRKELAAGGFKSGTLPGTNDYFIFAYDVEMSKLVSLYKSNGILASRKPIPSKTWYGDYCDSTLTSLCFPVGTCVEGDEHDGDEEDQDIFSEREYKEHREIQKIVKGIGAFDSLRQSKYTRWVYHHYIDIVDLLEELLKSGNLDGACTNGDNNKILDDTQKFCDLLNHMLESLLNTSAKMTISPSYPKIVDNYLPRLLLCYQKRINQLVLAWDAQYKKSDRKHVFFLHGQGGSSMRAYMFFSHLPPDKRIISIDVPLEQACQPEILLPMLVHEAGHSVGVRKRRVRVDYYVELAVQKFCQRLLKEMFKKNYRRLLYLLRKPEEDEDGVLIIHAFFALSEGFEKICGRVKEDYELFKEKCILLMNKDWQMAIANDYFDELDIIVRRVFIELLTSSPDFILDIFRAHIANWLEFQPLKRETFLRYNDKLLSYAQNAILAVGAGLDDQDQDRSAKSFLSGKEMVFGEVAADVFMVRVCGMSSRAYLRLRFEQYVGKNREQLAKYKVTLFASVQVTAVYAVILLSEYAESFEELKGLLNTGSQNLRRRETRRRLKEAFETIGLDTLQDILVREKQKIMDEFKGDEKLNRSNYDNFITYVHENLYWNYKTVRERSWISTLQKVANPTEIVIEYAWLIYHDRRYTYWDKNREVAMDDSLHASDEVIDPPDGFTVTIARCRDGIKKIYEMACGSSDKASSHVEVLRCLYENHEEGTPVHKNQP